MLGVVSAGCLVYAWNAGGENSGTRGSSVALIKHRGTLVAVQTSCFSCSKLLTSQIFCIIVSHSHVPLSPIIFSHPRAVYILIICGPAAQMIIRSSMHSTCHGPTESSGVRSRPLSNMERTVNHGGPHVCSLYRPPTIRVRIRFHCSCRSEPSPHKNEAIQLHVSSSSSSMAPFLRYVLCSLLFGVSSLTSAAAAAGNGTTADLVPDATSSLNFASSKWIWSSTTATAGTFVGLRKDFTPPLGKSLIAAEIIFTVYASLSFYVNGVYIGSGNSEDGRDPSRPRFARRFCVDLLPSYNVFAVNASASTSGTDEGGLIATILVTYSDGTTDTLVTDSSWRVKSGIPLGFEQPSFDDTAWPVATVVGSYGVGAWAAVLAYIPADPPVLSLDRADWIWTDVVPASGTLPAGSRAFRRTFTPAPGQVPGVATIIITADNEYTLYVNGVTIGSGTSWTVAQKYTVNFASAPTEIVLAVLATNTAASPAGLVVAMELNMVPSGRVNCTAGTFVLSDAGWKSIKTAIPSGWQQPGFDDSAWPAVVAEAEYSAAPWGTITIAAPSPPVTV
ncbi:hypothetical protein MSAN_01147200 [Mycena sanguinolenta]|uniref:Lectin n=1 Tax=Mycena sanguinolenta TaxID=230812 RepID=A0A8H6YLD1_9AGAR|nr:hypothetical protein MSAN_01147200 [Mycena sanguinolenta]